MSLRATPPTWPTPAVLTEEPVACCGAAHLASANLLTIFVVERSVDERYDKTSTAFPQQRLTLPESAGVASVIPACRCGRGSPTYSFVAYDCVTTAPAEYDISTEICAECTTVEANFPTSLHRAARTLHVSIFNETHTGNREAN